MKYSLLSISTFMSIYETDISLSVVFTLLGYSRGVWLLINQRLLCDNSFLFLYLITHCINLFYKHIFVSRDGNASDLKTIVCIIYTCNIPIKYFSNRTSLSNDLYLDFKKMSIIHITIYLLPAKNHNAM